MQWKIAHEFVNLEQYASLTEISQIVAPMSEIMKITMSVLFSLKAVEVTVGGSVKLNPSIGEFVTSPLKYYSDSSGRISVALMSLATSKTTFEIDPATMVLFEGDTEQVTTFPILKYANILLCRTDVNRFGFGVFFIPKIVSISDHSVITWQANHLLVTGTLIN